MNPQFDLTPDPRVLQMLGEINLDQWKCLAELTDNGIDSFLNSARSGNRIPAPEIVISLPTADHDGGVVTVRDNGPGMTGDQLENAVKAGWSGNNPLSSLGLFGMGFNIATARLGLVTEVWTTRPNDPDWIGVSIDLEQLRRTRSYHVPRQTRPKHNPKQSGTEIRILKLKQEHRLFFARGSNHQKIRKQLAKIYSPLLSSQDTNLRIQINGTQILPRRHCCWDGNRFVELSDGSTVSAIQRIDFNLAPRRHCMHCMTVFWDAETPCPQSGNDCQIENVARKLTGWIGLQRYLDENDFGIDLVRNGRVIEASSKDLFYWNDGERSEREYPLDDPRNRGRFVGEIHIDHCRVSYTKDRFERDDPSWNEMVRLVRGEGPLQPLKAKELGIVNNNTPLFRFFQAFRRSSPQGKAGRWSRVLVVKNNDRAMEMAAQFHRNDPDYQSDEKWWQLVEEEDAASLGIRPVPSPEAAAQASLPMGFLGTAATATPFIAPAVESPPKVYLPKRVPLHSMTREYVHPTLQTRFQVDAFATTAVDNELGPDNPWLLKLDDPATRTFLYLVNVAHEAFQSSTLTPLDALLVELAMRTADFVKAQRPDVTFQRVLADFRKQYSQESSLEAGEIVAAAHARLLDIGRSIVGKLSAAENEAAFEKLSEIEREHIVRQVALRGGTEAAKVIRNGEFLEYAEPRTLRRFIAEHPKLFFDGAYWDEPFAALDFGVPAVSDEARRKVAERFDNYLSDASWLASLSPRDFERAEKDAVIRARYSLNLLRPDSAN